MLIVALLAFTIGGTIRLQNMSVPSLERDIVIIKDTEVVESYLSKYRDQIGEDYDGYRNHIYRVLSYTHHFLGAKAYEKFAKEIQVALVYHDIGLWTDGELDYLDPSWLRAKADVSSEFNEEQLELIKNIIIYHHKLTSFQGKHSGVVNAVRNADWIDATMTLVTKGIPREQVRKVQEAIPNAGFHDTLRQFFFGPRVNGWNIFKSINEGRKIFYF